MASQIYEQIAEMTATCKKCESETEYKISYRVTMMAGQGPASQPIHCVDCGHSFEVLVPGPILGGPFAVPHNK